LRLVSNVLEAEGIDQKRWTPRDLASLIDGWKNRAIWPEKLPPGEARQFAEGKGHKLYQLYQNRLATLNAVDFGDLLLHTIRIFTEHKEVLADYHNKFRYILVDEYQDTNVAQYLWLRLLAQGHNNICCVGDDDQSIYGWRGAEVDNILRFEKDFPGAKVVRLEQNYRSTAHILAAASAVIANNSSRLGKTLRTDADSGDLVKVRGIWDGEQEARLICDDITSWRQNGRRYDECAVLVRASWQMRAFEERMTIMSIPFRVAENSENARNLDEDSEDSMVTCDDCVTIMTIHSSAGLEWPMVFLPGWEEEVFPSRRSLDEQGAKGLEEERRLAYVGITRARERAYISFAANRQIYERWTSVLPSRFVDELPAKHVDAISETGYVAPGGGFYGSEMKSQWDKTGGASAPRRGGSNLDEGSEPTVFDNTSAGGFRGGFDSPGWRRAQAAAATRGNTRPPDIAGRTFRSGDSDGRPLQRGKTPGDMLGSSDPNAAGGLVPGQRIFHDKFGYGRITDVEGAKVTVTFEKVGVKKVLENFVKRA
jgi:superfamily I DNA/RNA helicase